MGAKVALVAGVRPAFGLAPALRLVGLPASTWHYRQTHGRRYEAKHAHLRAPLEAIARTHPAYGYRRTTTELRARLGIPINRKVVQRLHRAWDLPLRRTVRPPRPSGVRQALRAAGTRANLVAALDARGAVAVLSTDFTDLIYRGGKATFILLLDHASKVVLGWAVGPGADTGLALQAWRQTQRTLGRLGRISHGVIVHHDQDGVFTGYGWMHGLLVQGQVRLASALQGAQDNPEMESFFGRFKTENAALFAEARDLPALRAVVARRIAYYNRRRRHSSLDNRPPWEVLQELLRSQPPH